MLSANFIICVSCWFWFIDFDPHCSLYFPASFCTWKFLIVWWTLWILYCWVFNIVSSYGYSFFKDFIYLFFRQRGRERNINVWLPLAHPLLGTWLTTKTCTLIGNWTGDSLVRRLALNPLSHTSQVPIDILELCSS